MLLNQQSKELCSLMTAQLWSQNWSGQGRIVIVPVDILLYSGLKTCPVLPKVREHAE